LKRPCRTSRRRQSGQSLVEYALILVLVALVVIGVLATVGIRIEAAFTNVLKGLGG
jgi:pilus assembly protein Flp/PilA